MKRDKEHSEICRGTTNAALCHGRTKFAIRGYVDSDFVSDFNKEKSTTCYVFTLTEEAMSWVSKDSKLHTITTKTKYMIDTEACKEVILIQRLFEEVGHKQIIS